MPGKRKRNPAKAEASRSTRSQTKKQVSRTAEVQTCESDRPVPTRSLAERDYVHLVAIFPEEVWRLIFDQLDNSADFENVSNSSLYFRDLLSSQRVNFLFHNIWNFLGEAFHQNLFHRGNIYNILIPPNIHDPSVNHDNNEETVGGRNDWYKEILKLRLVSRTWSTAIDNFYQNHPVHFRLQGHSHRNEDTIRDFLHANNLLSNSFLRRGENLLLQHFAPTHVNTNRNPFLGRCVHIKLSYISGLDNNFIIQKILNVFLEYGHHIWYCSIFIYDFANRAEFYSTIWEMLQLMPNLKILRVDSSLVSNFTRMEPLNLYADIKTRPLPCLNKLQMLMTREVPPSIFLELLRRNGHMSTLDVDRKESRYGYGIFKVPLKNLTKLALTFYSEASFLKIKCDTVNWPLTELYLDLESTSTFIDWQRVFNILEKFKATLTRLDLKLPVPLSKPDKDRIYREGHTYKLNLPLVTSLTLKMGALSCLDFLLPMRDSLVRLDIKMTVTDDTNINGRFQRVEAGRGRVLKLLSCARLRPWDANVFALFPKLNDVWLFANTTEPQYDIRYYADRSFWQKMMKMQEMLALVQN